MRQTDRRTDTRPLYYAYLTVMYAHSDFNVASISVLLHGSAVMGKMRAWDAGFCGMLV